MSYRFKSRKDHRQSVRFTRNGFTIRPTGRLSIAKVGEVRVRWTREALGLIRENQAVYVEDLNIAGMVRNRRLARAIHDAGWSQFVRLLEEKAERYARTVHTVSRWLPSSKACSDCGHVAGEMPLKIR